MAQRYRWAIIVLVSTVRRSPILFLAACLLSASMMGQGALELYPPADFTRTVVEGSPRLTVIHRDDDRGTSLVSVVSATASFYHQLFGPLPGDSLTVVEYQRMPFTQPGLAFLSAGRVDRDLGRRYILPDDRLEIARALAEQWWSGAVTIDSQHAVLGKGLVEFSACLSVYQQTDTAIVLYEALQQAADVLVSEIPAEPPQRTAAHGLWLMHMLRSLMIDQSTMSDAGYQTAIRSLYHNGKGRSITLQDLRTEVETVMGIDMGWFFDAWVPLTSIPIYEWSWRSSQGADGAYQNTIRVRQSNVPDSFLMYVPIKVILSDGTFERYRIKMVGAEAVLDLPASSAPVERIVFNEYASVLCAEREVPF